MKDYLIQKEDYTTLQCSLDTIPCCLVLPLKWPGSLSGTETTIPNSTLGVYIMLLLPSGR